MEKFFLTILQMSVTASYVIICILIARLFLKRAPKIISYCLWLVAVFRLICPFSFDSILSFLPRNVGNVKGNTEWLQSIPVSSSVLQSNSLNVTPVTQNTLTSVDPIQVYLWVGARLWIAGMIVMICYSMVSVFLLTKRLSSSRHLEDNIYMTDRLRTPFVFGVLKPSIYMPSGLSEEEKCFILKHEQTHIQRFDHLIKLGAFLILCLHWFNPLVWLAFLLMSSDMELSCDEKVIKEMGSDIKKDYSASLLSLAAGKRIMNVSPLAFGEGNVKTRIKNVLKYKKPSLWILVTAILAAVVLSVGLLTNPLMDNNRDQPLDTGMNSSGQEHSKEDLSVSYALTWLKDGKTQNSIDNLAGTDAQLAEDIIFNYSIKSAAWQGVDPTTLSECFLLRVTYNSGESTDYYAYQVDGKAVLQRGTDGYYSRIDDGLYAELAMLGKGNREAENNRKQASESTADKERTNLEACIRNAIYSANAGHYSKSDISTEAHTILKTVVKGETTIVYAMVLYLEFQNMDTGLQESGGSHMPIAITFHKNEAGEYELTEYWFPQDGSYYAPSIRKKFPADISKDAINTQKYVMAETRSCYEQAVEYGKVDTGKKLDELINTISSSPLSASNPKTYLDAHPIEYREMLFYGRYTLAYCFGLFDKGGQTGLKGQIMALACKDILGKEGSGIKAGNGQEWYDKFKKLAKKYLDKNGEDYMKEQKPGAWQLLQMLNGQ